MLPFPSNWMNVFPGHAALMGGPEFNAGKPVMRFRSSEPAVGVPQDPARSSQLSRAFHSGGGPPAIAGCSRYRNGCSQLTLLAYLLANSILLLIERLLLLLGDVTAVLAGHVAFLLANLTIFLV